MTFTGQNLGAGKPDRIKKSLLIALAQVVTIGVVVGQIMIIFYEPLASLYISADDPDRTAVLAAAKVIMTIMLSSYFIGAINEVLSGFLRGLGYSLQPMLISIGGRCVFRLFWINFVFPSIGELWSLYLVYPISWTLSVIALSCMIAYAMKKIKKKKLKEIQ
jgi:Na+-driven multidrug efflux pump